MEINDHTLYMKPNRDAKNFLQIHRYNIEMQKLINKMDELGPYCSIEELERIIEIFPEEFQNSFLYGYLKGIIDYRNSEE